METVSKQQSLIKLKSLFSSQNLHQILLHIDVDRAVAGEGAAALDVTGEGRDEVRDVRPQRANPNFTNRIQVNDTPKGIKHSDHDRAFLRHYLANHNTSSLTSRISSN